MSFWSTYNNSAMGGGRKVEEEWKDVASRRNSRERHAEKKTDRNVTEFYVSNLPIRFLGGS
ncbi:hypothetical protein Hanom_Chr02g00132291 [Helianthus anomalus]